MNNIKNYITKQAVVYKNDAQSFDIVLTEGKNRQIRRNRDNRHFHVSQDC